MEVFDGRRFEFKHELDELFTMVYLKLQNVGLSNDKKRRFRETPAMTLQGLQRLLMILGGQNAAEFRQIVLGVFTRYMAGTGPWSSWST